jgi:hypothetical protein
MPDIKEMLDSIIDGANNKFPNTINSTMHQNMGTKHPQTFDAGQFREKLSLYVLRDVISAMMHDDTKNLDGMIDQSIMQHIRDEYGCGCYDYLRKCCGRMKSPMMEDIVQEIDDKTEKTEKVAETQDDAYTQDIANMKNELPNIENYEQLRQQLRDIVSQKVVNDIAKEIKDSNDAPTTKGLDEKLTIKSTSAKDPNVEDADVEGEDVQSESVIMNIHQTIMTEAAVRKIPITQEQSMELAIIEFCMAEMDYLFKMDPTMAKIDKWQQPRPIQETFFERIYQEDAKSFLDKVAKNTAKMASNMTHKTADAMKKLQGGKGDDKPYDLDQRVKERVAQCRRAKKNYESYFSKGSKKRPTDEERLQYRAIYDFLQMNNHPENPSFKHPSQNNPLSGALSQDLANGIRNWDTNFQQYIANRKESYSEKLDRDLKQNGYSEYATEDSSSDHVYQEDAKSSMEFLDKFAKKTGEMSGKLLKHTGNVLKNGLSGSNAKKSETGLSAEFGALAERCRKAKKNYESYFSAGSKRRPTDDERLQYRAIYDYLRMYNHPVYGKDDPRYDKEGYKHPGNQPNSGKYWGRVQTDLHQGLANWCDNFQTYIKNRKESYSEKLDRELKQNGYREYATDESSDDDFFE